MRTRLPFLLLPLLLVLLHSCTQGDKTGTEQTAKATFYEVSLEKALDDATKGVYQTVSLSDIGKEISYIPLELNSNSAFRKIRRIIITDSSIFINDINKMLQFDISGSFICQIGRQGKGPGEYIYAMDFFVTDTLRCIDVGSRFNVYNRKGLFIGFVHLDASLEFAHILLMDDDKIVFQCHNVSESMSKNSNSLFITNMDFNVIKTFKNSHKRIEKSNLLISDVPFYKFQENVRFKEWGVDTLYTVRVDSLIPYALFDLGHKSFPPDPPGETYNQNPDKEVITNIIEDKKNLYMQFDHLSEKKPLYGLYSKQTGDTKILGESGFQNDLDGGLPFFPRYVYNDSILVDWVDAYDLREKVLKADAAEMHKLYGKKFDNLLKLAKSLNDDSGTVLGTGETINRHPKRRGQSGHCSCAFET